MSKSSPSNKTSVARKAPSAAKQKDIKRLETVIQTTLRSMKRSDPPTSVAFRPHRRQCVVGFTLKKDDDDGAWTAHDTFVQKKVEHRPSYARPAYATLYNVLLQTCHELQSMKNKRRAETLRNMR